MGNRPQPYEVATKVVLACGVFDLLHVAHKRHLEQARTFGDVLVVGVTKDSFVGKPGRPIIPEDERLEMVRALGFVSAAFLTEDSTYALTLWRPDIFVKGHDYTEKGLLPKEIELCKQYHTEIRFTDYHPQTTTRIVEKCKSS